MGEHLVRNEGVGGSTPPSSTNAFINESQKRVNGYVKVKLQCASARVIGRKSPDALYAQDMVSFDSQTLSQRDAEGFAKYHGFQARLLKRMRS